MQFIYPQSLLDPRAADEIFREEAEAMAEAGHHVCLIDTEALASDSGRIRPALNAGMKVVYRGWMLTYCDYVLLAAAVERGGGICFTSPDQYIATHYLPNWYSLARDFTPETVFYDADADLVVRLRQLGWGRFFVKDYVKSLKTSVGAIIEHAEQ